MGKAGKSFASSLVLVMIVSSLSIIGYMLGASAQAGTNVNGIIRSDTVWTQAGSPYSFTGPVAVNQGVTLTIEAGTTVNLNYYYLQVNGTLTANGTSATQIVFNGGETRGITFTSLSNGWNEQTESGCIIQNAIINSNLNIFSVKVDHSVMLRSFYAGGASIVTNNNITGGIGVSGTTILSSNVISGILSAPVGPSLPIVSVTTDSNPNAIVIVANNTIHGGNPTFGGLQNIGISCYGYASISLNTVTNCEAGIRIYSSSTPGFPLVQKNILVNNLAGILIRAAGAQSPGNNSPLIKENLITNNTAGISVEAYGGTVTPAILNNNIYLNHINLAWGLASNLDVSNNWWGTTDPQAINQTIGDNKNNFNLGIVNFIPFLTAPDLQAPTAPTSTPVSTPTVPEFSLWTVSFLLILMVVSGLFVHLKKHNRTNLDAHS